MAEICFNQFKGDRVDIFSIVDNPEFKEIRQPKHGGVVQVSRKVMPRVDLAIQVVDDLLGLKVLHESQ